MADVLTIKNSGILDLSEDASKVDVSDTVALEDVLDITYSGILDVGQPTEIA